MMLALGACANGHDGHAQLQAAASGPSSDYPMVLGEPFSIDGKLYTPEDKLSYDEVGHAVADTGGASAISAAHRTLPLPSYVEVTSLDTGRTILVRVERRGPMTGQSLIALAPGAMEQLAGQDGDPVRVRRVNPPEQERALLRGGKPAPERMATPPGLIAVLKRKLPQTPMKIVAAPVFQAEPVTSPPEAAPAEPTVSGFMVQAGAFASKANADRLAQKLGGSVAQTGKFFAVRTGPFANRGLAEASLAKVRTAGYIEARILSSK